jgi:hypothetical protein
MFKASAHIGCAHETAADKLPAKGKELVMRIGEDQQEFEILPEEEPPVVVPEPEPPRQPEDTPA